jgi:hypothetical protein
VSPDAAVAIAWRSEQFAPGQVPPASSKALVTVRVAASADTATSRAEMKPASEVRYRQRDFFISKHLSLSKRTFRSPLTLREEGKVLC